MKAAPKLGDAAAARVAVYSEKPQEKLNVAQKPAPPAVATVQWQEPEDMPPLKRSEPKRPAKNTNSRSAGPAACATTQVDRTPFHWGFFGAETRW